VTAPPSPGGRTRARLVQRLFEAAVDLDPAARGAYLEQACVGDRVLREEVEGLLRGLGAADTNQVLPPLFATAGGTGATGGGAAPAPRPDLVGLRLNNYEVVAPLAEGGMGTLYRARHRFIERQAALKVLHPDLSRDREMVQRFLNEARAANAIRHPHIIEVVDAGLLAESGTPYILMELLDGQSLGARLRAGRLPVAEAVAIALPIADALAAAHEQGIVHRDLKPENVFLAQRPGQEPLVKVLDFGIAKLRADLAGTAARTQAGMLLGTPQYMAPEQCRDVSAVDRRTDVYALGLILYEMLRGEPAFPARGGVGEVLYQQLTATPAPLRTLRPELPPALAAAVARCLEKDPAQRFDSMATLAQALRASVGDAAGRGTGERARSGPPMSSSVATGRYARGPSRRARAAAVVGLLLLTAAASMGLAWWHRSSTPVAAPAVPTTVATPTAVAPGAAGALPAAARRESPGPPDEPPPGTSAPAPASPPARPARTRPPQPRPDIPEFLRKNPYR
jgi:tRNA A-37 threonylcarbamoyl transferase component Bud32